MMEWRYSNYSKVNPNVLRHFPFTKPRADQLETVSEILEAINEGYRYIVLEAGTGTGKSAVAATLANIFDDSYILTVTKQLQDQYLRDFRDFKLVKGRQNFKCLNSNRNCDLGKCIVEGCVCKYKKSIPPACPYYKQKFDALNAKTVVSNYPYMFLELNYVEDFQKRSLLVCDEAHNLESQIMNQLQLQFTRSELKEFANFELDDDVLDELSSSRYDSWISFINNIKDIYINKLENIKDKEKIVFLKNRISDCNQFVVNITFDAKMWIFDWDDDTETLSFKPIKVDHYANMLLRHADVCIFMSATIIDYLLFAKYLGINPDEIYPIRKKSPFDIKRNPIIPLSSCNLSKAYLKSNAPKTVSVIEDILHNHENDKGIIHTVSSQCRDYLSDAIKSDRLVSGDIEDFKSSDEPLVLISPSLDEGVDLPGDLCRFQIIYKIPYLDLGDCQIKMRMAMDSEWYDYRTTLRLIQTHGRGMRDENDYSRTYVIDSRFNSYVINNRMLPDSFRDAITNPGIDEMIKKGEDLIKSNDYASAIRHYSDLINRGAFVNDAYPYLKLSRIYREMEIYDAEVNIIVRFLKSGIRCSDTQRKYFQNRLAELEVLGYFDYDIVK